MVAPLFGVALRGDCLAVQVPTRGRYVRKDPRPALLRLRVRLLGFGCWSGEDLSLRRWSTEQRHRVTVSFFFTSIRRRAEGRRMNREMDRTLLNVVPVGRHVHRKGTTAWKGYPALRSVVDEVRILVRVLGAASEPGATNVLGVTLGE